MAWDEEQGLEECYPALRGVASRQENALTRNRGQVLEYRDYFEQESLTICTSVTFRCPCSLFSFVMPVSWAMSLVSSFRLWAVAFETTPVAVTLCPTCSDSFTVLLRTSH